MARKKLSPEEQKIQDEQNEIKRIEEQLQRQKEDALNKFMPKNPTYFFEIGEKVVYGAHPNAEIEEIYENGLAYKLLLHGKHRVYHNIVNYKENQIVSWIYLRKFVSKEEYETRIRFSKDNNIHLKQYNTGLSSLFTTAYNFGLDLDVDYQRDHVWALEDKQALIESILKKIEIGKFIFIRRSYDKNNPDRAGYEVLDGKQRLTAIKDFYEDRITYNGLTYSQLHWKDQYAFEQYQVSYMEGENLTEKQILETFIKYNTHGKVMSKDHLQKVADMLKKLNDEDK